MFFLFYFLLLFFVVVSSDKHVLTRGCHISVVSCNSLMTQNQIVSIMDNIKTVSSTEEGQWHVVWTCTEGFKYVTFFSQETCCCELVDLPFSNSCVCARVRVHACTCFVRSRK